MASDPKPRMDFDTVEEWERWLQNDPPPTGILLRIRKKNAPVPGIGRQEALDVALCFGWIDGQAMPLDDNYFLLTHTPRRARSMWSQVNQEHVARLIADGRMRPEGLAEIERAKADGRWAAAYRQKDAVPPPELQAALDASPKAAAAFAARSAQARFAMIFRLGALKRQSSRDARVAEYIATLEAEQSIT